MSNLSLSKLKIIEKIRDMKGYKACLERSY